MTTGRQRWTYSLASDVKVCLADRCAILRTAITETRIDGADELRAIELLAAAGGSEAEIQNQFRSEGPEVPVTSCSALLFRLDRMGLLARTLSDHSRVLATADPMRPPPRALPHQPPTGPLRLSRHALGRIKESAIWVEVPGSWARMTFHDRELLPLLQDLAGGLPSAEAAAEAARNITQATLWLLALMSWCELFDDGDHEGWPSHALLFHTRTRRGYRRAALGKIHSGFEIVDHPGPGAAPAEGPLIALEPPDLSRLLATDPPFALVCERRRSVRRPGSIPLLSRQLSEFLFRTLRDQGGSRPYPSAGERYPLEAYVLVNRCLGLSRALYAYEPGPHALRLVLGAAPGLDKLLDGAAGAAGVDDPPQVLLVLAARFERSQRMYGDLGYSLILKEAGAVFQSAMMAAAAMGLGACPLGCGDSLLFSKLIGVSPYALTSVGELMLSSLESSDPAR
jgi:oxazoline/thiazoline dehydrogenase